MGRDFLGYLSLVFPLTVVLCSESEHVLVMVTLFFFFFLTSVQLVCMRHSSSKEPNIAQQQKTKVRQKYSFILL